METVTRLTPNHTPAAIQIQLERSLKKIASRNNYSEKFLQLTLLLVEGLDLSRGFSTYG